MSIYSIYLFILNRTSNFIKQLGFVVFKTGVNRVFGTNAHLVSINLHQCPHSLMSASATLGLIYVF